MAECLIGLGSNLGDRAAHLETACRLLCGHPQIQESGRSALHATAPVGGPAGQTAFLNAALRVTTSLSPGQLLEAARHVEQELGRQRRERWGPRVIDIDLLLYDQRMEETDQLILPHPRMAFRRFVLGPACEVAADMLHPTTGWTMAELLRRLDEPPHYVAIAGMDAEQAANLAVTVAHISGAHALLDPHRPPGPAAHGAAVTPELQWELRAIDARRAQLANLPRAAGGAGAVWHICSYWLPQSLAAARVLFAGPAGQQLEQACSFAISQMPLPHCVVFLDAPPRATGAVPAAGAHGTATRAQPARMAALAAELAHQLSLPGQGPVLRIPDGDMRLALTELTAAIDAMR